MKNWKTVVKIAIAVLTALLGAVGVSAYAQAMSYPQAPLESHPAGLFVKY